PAMGHPGPRARAWGEDEPVREALLRDRFRFGLGRRFRQRLAIRFLLGLASRQDRLAFAELLLHHLLNCGTAEILEFVLEGLRGGELHAAFAARRPIARDGSVARWTCARAGG